MTATPALEVRAVHLHAGGGALADRAGNARHTWRARSGMVVAVELAETDGGSAGIHDDAPAGSDRSRGRGARGRALPVVGLGEASPLPGLSRDVLREEVAPAGDRPADVAGTLEHARRRLVGRTVSGGGDALDGIAGVLDRVVPEAEAAPSARFALETALLDGVARARGVSMATLLGAPGAARVEISALLGDPGAGEAVRCAQDLISSGARTLKLKLATRPLRDDLAAIAALRAAIGPAVRLVGDSNGAWSVDEARAAAPALAVLGVSALEQPVAPEALASLGPLPVAVWADESLTDPAGRAALLALPHLAGVVLKPTVLGGLHVARGVARAAAARTLGVTVTHALEGPVALAACAALALALVDLAPRAGLWRHAGLSAWPGTDGVRWGAELVDGAGSGLTETDRIRLREGLDAR